MKDKGLTRRTTNLVLQVAGQRLHAGYSEVSMAAPSSTWYTLAAWHYGQFTQSGNSIFKWRMRAKP